MNKRQAYYILDPQTDTKQEGDECWNSDNYRWERDDAALFHTRVYRRPVHDAVTLDDGWIPWSGGECPVDPETRLIYKTRNGDVVEENYPARMLRWEHSTRFPPINDIIAYKVIEPAPKQPLDCDDVPPGSVFRQEHYLPGVFITNLAQNSYGITTADNDQELVQITWATLMSKYQIKRPGEDWKPCCK